MSTSSLVQRLSVEQTAIAARLLELEGIEEIRNGLKNTNINSDEIMHIDVLPEPRVIDAKQRALSRYVCPCTGNCTTRPTDSCSLFQAPLASNNANHQVGSLSLQEAVELERRAHVIDLEKQQRSDDRKRRIGLPVRGETLSRQEMDARIWAFMFVFACTHF